MREKEQNLKSLTKCPLCKAEYSHSQTLILEESESQTIFHLTCDKCKSSVLAFITEGKQGVVSLGLATDLSAEEAARVLKRKSISQEEVLEIYKYLNNK